jgi:formimidoylglutamate deiminase
VQWLLGNLPVNERFHLVHATHLDDAELSGLAASRANVVLCPSTEGNLGDGIFRMKEFSQLGGHWSIGTDSHIGINPLEELRMIDYRQRLETNQRNTFEGDAARYLVNEEFRTGQMAMGLISGNHFEVGHPLNAVVYDAAAPLMNQTSTQNLMSTIVYASDQAITLGTIVLGKWVVRDQHHRAQSIIRAQFADVMRQLASR